MFHEQKLFFESPPKVFGPQAPTYPPGLEGLERNLESSLNYFESKIFNAPMIPLTLGLDSIHAVGTLLVQHKRTLTYIQLII